MNKKMIKTILLSLCSMNAFSAATLPPFVTNALQHQTTNTKVSGTFTDFTGIWKAPSCLGSTEGVQLIIRNDEFEIELGSTYSLINALETRSTSDAPHNPPHGETTFINWNTDKTELTVRVVNVRPPSVKQNYQPATSENPIEITFNIYNLSLNNQGQLLLNWQGEEYRDFQRIDEWNPSCVFDKIGDPDFFQKANTPQKINVSPNKHPTIQILK